MTLWRSLLYKQLSTMELSGDVLDLGGSRRSGYHELFKGNSEFTVINLDPDTLPDVLADLEQPLALSSERFDTVLAINILEHIYNYRQFLAESYRVLKPGGNIIIGVPFLMPVHPSPHDYWRFTDSALRGMLRDSGFRDIDIAPLGYGPFTAAAHLQYNVLYVRVLRAIATWPAVGLDRTLNVVCRGRFAANRYPLGYLGIARK